MLSLQETRPQLAQLTGDCHRLTFRAHNTPSTKTKEAKKKTDKSINATPQPEHTVLSLSGTTYDDASELEMELRLEARWFPSGGRPAIAGTTSWERWILGDTLFLLAPLSGATKHTWSHHTQNGCVRSLALTPDINATALSTTRRHDFSGFFQTNNKRFRFESLPACWSRAFAFEKIAFLQQLAVVIVRSGRGIRHTSV